jgi:peptidoglycan/LPS O-acetylase OafA/YrhL
VRGVGVAIVVVHHLKVQHLGGLYTGVDLFFALSGFLITGSLLRDGVRLRSFWSRRAWRVGPAAAVLLGWYVTVSLWDPQRSLRMHFANAAALQYINIDMADGPPPGTTSPHLGHLWSLAAEIQFYVLWPLVLLILFRRHLTPGRVFALATAIAVASAAYRWHLGVEGVAWGRLYFGPDARGTALFVGAAVAALVYWRDAGGARHALRSLDRASAFLVLPAVGVFAWYGWTSRLDSRPGLTWGLTLIALAAGVIVLHASSKRPTPVNRFLGSRLVSWVGDISFSLYLWHVPVIAVVIARWPDIATTTKAIVVLPVSVALAAASYYAVERPMMSKRRRDALLRRRPASVETTAA